MFKKKNSYVFFLLNLLPVKIIHVYQKLQSFVYDMKNKSELFKISNMLYANFLFNKYFFGLTEYEIDDDAQCSSPQGWQREINCKTKRRMKEENLLRCIFQMVGRGFPKYISMNGIKFVLLLLQLRIYDNILELGIRNKQKDEVMHSTWKCKRYLQCVQVADECDARPV